MSDKVLTAKKHEFAPGIPKQKPMSIMPVIEKPTVFEFGVHDHESVKAGRHYDLRLGDKKTGKAYSWAIPSAKLPAPGEKPVLAIPTFIHDVRYMDFEGIIGSDYGRGIVKLPHRGKAVVHKASPEYVKFTALINGEPNTFILFKPKEFGNAYLLRNVTKKEEPQKEAQEIPQEISQARWAPHTQALVTSAKWAVPLYILDAALSRGSRALASSVKDPKISQFLASRKASIWPALTLGGIIGFGKTYYPYLKSKIERVRSVFGHKPSPQITEGAIHELPY